MPITDLSTTVVFKPHSGAVIIFARMQFLDGDIPGAGRTQALLRVITVGRGLTPGAEHSRPEARPIPYVGGVNRPRR